jgi:hypothetical protein
MVLGPVLKLINGPTVANALADPQSELSKLVATEKDDTKLIEEVFLRFLARKPTETELKVGLEAMKLAKGDEAKAAAALAEYEKQLPAKQAAWEKIAGQPVVWKELEFSEMSSAVGATFKKLDDKSILVTGKLEKDVYTITAKTDLQGITGFKLEALADASLPASGPGRAQNGNFVLSELKVSLAPAGGGTAAPVELAGASADFSQEGFHVSAAIDGSDQTGWAVSPQFGKTHEAIFETKIDAGSEGGSLITISLSQQYADGKHCLGKFRWSATDGARPLTKSKLPDLVAAALAAPRDKRSADQAATIAAHYRSLDAELARLSLEVQKAAEQSKSARAIGVQDLAWALINNPAFLFNR